jgi:hypothetical protein
MRRLPANRRRRVSSARTGDAEFMIFPLKHPLPPGFFTPDRPQASLLRVPTRRPIQSAGPKLSQKVIGFHIMEFKEVLLADREQLLCLFERELPID